MAYRRRFFLVDTENTGARWISALSGIREKDEIYLFFTDKSPGYKNSEVEQVIQIQNKISWIHRGNGSPNALDFQLVTWLGFQIKGAPKTEYIIVSNDHGYDAAVQFWSGRGICVSRMDAKTDCTKENIKENTPLQEPSAKKENTAGKSQAPLKGIPANIRPTLNTLMRAKYKSEKNLQLAYNAILTGNKEEIYRVIHQIAGKTKDAETMKKTWIKCMPSIQKSAKTAKSITHD